MSFRAQRGISPWQQVADIVLNSKGVPQALFQRKDVTKLVECAKRALEADDRYLMDRFHKRNWINRPVGILANDNEHYYQFIIWRELMCSFDWRPMTEREERSDVAFFDDETGRLVARAQIKVWRGV